ncbi:MAG: hypothetical protein KUG78_12415 [Kangiellaceae bacterium]|nr:hypothetical protein [Kangiellaceae bacterium]
MTSNLKEDVQWSSEHEIRSTDDRRESIDRRQYKGRSITVPDMRAGAERRVEGDRRNKVRLTITGRAMDI